MRRCSLAVCWLLHHLLPPRLLLLRLRLTLLQLRLLLLQLLLLLVHAYQGGACVQATVAT